MGCCAGQHLIKVLGVDDQRAEGRELRRRRAEKEAAVYFAMAARPARPHAAGWPRKILARACRPRFVARDLERVEDGRRAREKCESNAPGGASPVHPSGGGTAVSGSGSGGAGG